MTADNTLKEGERDISPQAVRTKIGLRESSSYLLVHYPVSRYGYLKAIFISNMHN